MTSLDYRNVYKGEICIINGEHMSYDMSCEGCGKPLIHCYHKIILRKEIIFICDECFSLWIQTFNKCGLVKLHGEKFRKKFEKVFKAWLKKRQQKMVKVKFTFT